MEKPAQVASPAVRFAVHNFHMVSQALLMGQGKMRPYSPAMVDVPVTERPEFAVSRPDSVALVPVRAAVSDTGAAKSAVAATARRSLLLFPRMVLACAVTFAARMVGELMVRAVVVPDEPMVVVPAVNRCTQVWMPAQRVCLRRHGPAAIQHTSATVQFMHSGASPACRDANGRSAAGCTLHLNALLHAAMQDRNSPADMRSGLAMQHRVG